MLVLAKTLPAQTFQSGPDTTVLIELYTSEGCSSCPPADRWLSALQTDKGLWTRFVPVALHITYWDDLGWPDPYAKPAFTQRQRGYAAAWNAPSVYTPEFIYQGQEWRPGNPTPPVGNPGVLLVQRSADGGGKVSFKPSANSAAQRYDASVAMLGADVSVKVGAGENGGRTLASHPQRRRHLYRRVQGSAGEPAQSRPPCPRRLGFVLGRPRSRAGDRRLARPDVGIQVTRD